MVLGGERFFATDSQRRNARHVAPFVRTMSRTAAKKVIAQDHLFFRHVTGSPRVGL